MNSFRNHPFRVMVIAALALAVPIASAGMADERKPLVFEVTYDAEVHPGPISSRVYVMLGPPNGQRDPRFGPNWFNPQPFFAVDVEDWMPGEPARIDGEAVGFPPRSLDELEPGEYDAQAVVRLNPDTHRIGNGEGNAFGPVVRVTLDPENGGTVTLMIDQKVPPRPFEETERIKLVNIPSPMLSAFHGREVRHRAAVVLPEGELAESEKRPTLYIVPGFGGDHHMAHALGNNPRFAYAQEMIRVVLDPDCGTGHHTFADSATNGPRGQALIDELIPYIEDHFPALSNPRARLLNGHSSGGWSTLWLQINSPGFFGGTWSTAPDPVDFRDFQRINLYQPGENMFFDENGERRPIARRGERPVLFYEDFSKMEDVIGDGGQLRSFEAVFSPLGPDGSARRLWDRDTGAIDPEVAEAWKAYDIRLILQEKWDELGPKLAGKIRVVMGDLDTFYLDGATKLLKDALEELDSDAVIEIVPGRDHGTVLDRELAERFDREMRDAVADFLPEAEPTSDGVADGQDD